MEIIKEGNLKTIVFKCDKCGCVFEANETEYKEDWRTPKPECECPTCHKITNQTIGRNSHVSI